MKNRLFSTSIVLAVASGLLWLSVSCGRKDVSGEEVKPYLDNSFHEVTAQLNPGGDFYLFAGTDQLVSWVNDLFDYLLSPEISATMGSSPEKTVAGIRWFRTFLADSGLMAVDGIGISSVQIAEQLHHSTVVIHRSHAEDSQLMSRWTRGTPHSLDSLAILPEDTVFASFSDHASADLWQWLDRHMSDTEIEELSRGWNRMKSGLTASGIDLSVLLGSLGREIGLVLTLDKAKRFPIPGDRSQATLPVPGLAVVVDTQDDTLFDLLRRFIPQAELKEEKEYKTLSMPALPLPFELKFQICQKKGRLILASSSALLETLRNGVKPPQALVDNLEFREMARHMPEKGNGFRYLSGRLWQEISQIIQKKMSQEQSAPSAAAGIGMLTRLLPPRLAQYSVMRHQDDSINIKINHSFPTGHLVLLPAVSSVGIITAIAIPNLIKAREQAAKVINEDPGSHVE